MGRRTAYVDINIGDTTPDTTLTADRGVYFLSDGRRREEQLLNDGYDDVKNTSQAIDTVSSVPGRKRKDYASSSPLHVIKEWNGHFWCDTTLAALGLVYQLGHGGFPCVFPDDKVYKMTVIEAPIIHQLRIRYCNCDKSDNTDHLEQLLRNAWYPASLTDPATCATFKTLEAYRLYNVVGNMNVNDFIHSMERATDATASTGMAWLPDRYKQFQRMAQQWAFLKHVKRAGRGHDPEGVDATELRACAVSCWACPHDGRNLPDDWRDVEPRLRFLYMLLLAVDANFKLKNRMRPNEIDDPSLGPGWGYWVEPKRYRKHIRKYVGEKDMSQHLHRLCRSAAKRYLNDYRITHLGCRWLRGERYSNMDYIILSALFGFTLMLLTISYDIACQWKKSFPEPNEKMPKELRLPLSKFTMQCALPVWHAGLHNEDCQDDNSLSFKPGVGKSDGEGVERVWSVLNPASHRTKDAGRGQRVDTLEDKIDSHNHLKNLGQGESLQRKLLVAIAERDRQIRGYKEVSATIERDVINSWKKKIAAYVIQDSYDSHTETRTADCPTEAEVRLEVKKDEEAAITEGASPLQGRSATVFLIAGLQIEEAQRHILVEVGGTTVMTADREGKLLDWRRALLVKIAKFRDLQKIYMPGAALVLAEAEERRDADAAPPKAEKVKLFMPSEMCADAADPLRGCVKGLLSMEAKLRAAQCNNSLAKLRARLHAKHHFISFRNENLMGQSQTTRAQTLIGQIGERVNACVVKYRHARSALIKLEGEEGATQFRELWLEDVQLDGDTGESDAAARKKLAMIGSAPAKTVTSIAGSPQPNLSCFRTPTTPLSFSLAQRPHYNLRPASAHSFTVTPPSKQNKKKAEAAPKPVIHPPFSAAQTKARWAPLVCSEVKAMIPLLQSETVPRRSCGQLQGIFQGCERVMKKFRAETDIGPIEIEAFLLSIWIAVREAKDAYPEFAWKKSFPTLYNIVPPDLDRRAEIETFIPSLPDSHFELPRIPASLRYASSGDEAPPPTKKARHRSPSVAETPPPQASSSRRQLTPPVVERPKPKPIGRGAAVVGRGHQAARSISPDVEEIAPTGNIHAADQAADIDAYVRRTHDMGYVSDHFDEVAEIYPNVVDKPAGGILAPPVAVEKVSSVVVHDATIVPEGHVTFYICSNCATRGQRCISRGLGKRCFSCNKGKMSCSLHPSVLQLLIAQERLRPLNNVGSISIMNVLQRVIVARRNADLHHYLLRNSMLDYDDVLSEACILLEQQRQVLKPDDLASCFENPQDLQTLSTLFARLGIDYGSAMSDLRDRNPPPEVFGLSKDGDVVPEGAAEPETHFYVHGPTQQTVFGEFDRLPAESRQVEERVHRIPAGYTMWTKEMTDRSFCVLGGI
ncbi:hypothetical protein DFH06DRAFT_1338758 [Mycena polygramma]|nr:hypothetical protein DFH06DRAFT_1338758 [Mycena polygramma]